MIRVYETGLRREEVTVNKPNPQTVGLYRHMGVMETAGKTRRVFPAKGCSLLCA